MDFNSMIAQANKNSTNAQKLLQQKEKFKKKELQKKDTNDKAAIEFINKRKEEARIRAEQEAKELLEKRRQKNETLNPPKVQKQQNTAQKSTNSKQSSTKQSSTSANGAAKSTKSNDSKLKTANGSSKSVQSSSNSQLNSKKTISTNKARPPLNYSEMLKLADSLHKEKLKPTSSSLATSSSSSAASTLSFNKNTKSSTNNDSHKTQIAKNISKSTNELNKIQSTTHTLTNNNNNSNNYVNSKNHKSFLPGDIRAKSNLNTSLPLQQTNKNNSNIKPNSKTSLPSSNRPTNSSVSSSSSANNSKNVSVNNNKNGISSKSAQQQQQNTTKNTVKNNPSQNDNRSAWDRIISDVKKVKPNNPKIEETSISKKRPTESSEDEDEYDSEMDDFIDDESEEEEVSQNYSKQIREIFKYNPNRYRDREDDDDRNMESSYHQIMKEERESMRLGYLEDLEDMKQEAEMKKKVKKQKTN